MSASCGFDKCSIAIREIPDATEITIIVKAVGTIPIAYQQASHICDWLRWLEYFLPDQALMRFGSSSMCKANFQNLLLAFASMFDSELVSKHT